MGAAITPTSESELAEAIATANTPLRIIGGGTRRALGNPCEGQALRLDGLSGVSLYEPGALTLVAKAGTPLSEIEALLKAEGQRLPFEPMDHCGLLGSKGTPTIGGVVAANVSGPRRIQAGACRDSLIGVRFVDGQGTVLKNGGRVMKNVTGYDLVKLLAGSFGTLGVLSEVSFKLLPASEAVAVVILHGLDDKRAIAALTKALGSPYDVTGAAHVSGDDARTLIRVEGFANSVAYRAEKLKELLAEFGDVSVSSDAKEVHKIWADVRDVAPYHAGEGDVWRISVKPTDGPDVGARIAKIAGKVCYDWGGGLVWALVPAGSDVRRALDGIAGHAMLVRGSDETKQTFGAFASSGIVLDTMQAQLRGKFDPKGILNPGLMAVVT